MDIVEKARRFAMEKHKGQKDDEGWPYIHHPDRVASIMKEITEDLDLITAAYLHDTIEDTDTTYDELVGEFGEKVADLVMEVTHEGKKDNYGYWFPRLKTKEGIMLKFADRLSNLSRMGGWDEKRKEHYLKKSKFWKSDFKQKEDEKMEEKEKKEIDDFVKDKQEKEAKEIRSNITFKLDNPYYVTILSDGKEAGSIWSELGKTARFPYPHNNKQINKIQICGFDTCSEVWGCGRYEGKKDLTLEFKDMSDKFHRHQLFEYRIYVQRCISNNNLEKMQSFHDFCRYNAGQFF